MLQCIYTFGFPSKYACMALEHDTLPLKQEDLAPA